MLLAEVPEDLDAEELQELSGNLGLETKLVRSRAGAVVGAGGMGFAAIELLGGMTRIRGRRC